MLATILLKLLLFLAVVELASAIAGHRVYGTRFSLALPRISSSYGIVISGTTGSLVIMTEEERSTVYVYYPSHSTSKVNRYKSYKTYSLVRKQAKEITVLSSFVFPKNSRTGVYNTVKITSSSPIRVILNRYNIKRLNSADFHNVMPLESCSTSYYVSTGHGHSFLMVTTFDSKVNARVTFGKTGQKFNFACHAETRCKDGTSVLLTLGENKAWYVEQENGVRFLNTLIETDQPVFVIAGNKALETTGKSLNDLVVTSIYPTEAWGKEYITPRFTASSSDQRNLVFQFNAKELPFKFKTFDGVEVKFRNEVISNFDSYFTIRNSQGFYIITADVPFGLYQIFGLQGQNYKRTDCVATIVNLIPTEQWSNGVVIRMPEDEHRYFYKCFTSATKKGYVLFGSRDNKVIWEPGHIRYNKHFYYAGNLKIKPGTATFFTKDPLARMIVYQFRQSVDYISCSATAVDFYQTSIHQKDCRQDKNVVANDGVDNDCDGRVDEEIKDKKDNDGDGRTDEDLIETNGRNTWAGWYTLCLYEISLYPMSLRFRACVQKRFGQDCSGSSVSCPRVKTQLFCELKQSPHGRCKVPKGCEGWVKKDKTCDYCKAGYYNEQLCLRPCPKSWKGKGCSQGPLKWYPIKKWVPRKPDDWTDKDAIDPHSGTSSDSNDKYMGNTSKKQDQHTSKEHIGSSTEPPAVHKGKRERSSISWILLGILLLVTILTAICIAVCFCRKRPVKVEQTEVVEEEKVEEVQLMDESSVDTTSMASSDWQTTDYSVAESEL